MRHCFRDLKVKNSRSKEQWTICTRVYLGVSWRQHPLPVNTSEPENTDNNEKCELPNSDTSNQLNNSNSDVLLQAVQDHGYSIPVSSQCTEGTDFEITGRKSSESGIAKKPIKRRKSSKSKITKKVKGKIKKMGTNRDSTNTKQLLEDIKVACERLVEMGLESLMIIVDRDNSHLCGSQIGRDYLDDKNLLIEDFIQYCKDNRPANLTEKKFISSPAVIPGNTVSNLNNLNGNAGSHETEYPKLPEVQDDLELFDRDTVDYEQSQEIDLDVLDNMYKLVRTENNPVPEGKTNHVTEDNQEGETDNNCSEVTIENQRKITSHTERVKQSSNINSEESAKIYEVSETYDTTANTNGDGEIEIIHECTDCELSFKSALELAAHRGREHEKLPEEGAFPCTHCGFIFVYEAHLKEHNERNPKCIIDISVKKKKDFSALQYQIKVKDSKSGEMKKRRLKQILDISGIKLPVKCPLCQKSFKKLYAYQCHILFHSEIKLCKCHICLKSFNCKSSLPRHLTAHKDRLYFCGTCHNRFENKARRDHHVSYSCKKTKHRPGLICSECGYQTKSMSHLMLHKRTHTYVQCKCDVCGQFLKSAENLHRHLVKSHGIPFQCEICGKTFKHKDTLKRHGKEHGELKYKCKVCGKPWSELSKLNRHLKIHSSEKIFPFICEMCGKAFRRKSILDSHRFLHTGETPFKCDIEGCGKAFRSMSALKQHKEYHVTFHPFMCDYCGRSFKREYLLRHHCKSHTEWQWPCDYCEEKFNSRKRFKSHVAAHHQDKIQEIEKKTKMAFFKCTVCSKILPQKTVFMDHMSIHNGVKPHKCKFCKKSFSAKSNLRQHEKIHTGGKKLHCKFCSRTYDDPKALEIHSNKKHKEKLDNLAKTNVAVVKNDSEAELQTATASLSLNIDRQMNVNSECHPDLLNQKPTDTALQLEVIQSDHVPVHVVIHASEFQSLVNDNHSDLGQ